MRSFKTLDLFSRSSPSRFSHSFILVLLTEHLLCASTVLDTGNRAMKETDGAHVLMELTPGMLHVVLDSSQCRQDINLGTSGMGYRL